MDAIRIKLGSIATDHSELTVMLSIKDSGVGTIDIYCTEHHCDGSGYLILTAPLWEEFKAIIAKADATIAKLKETGQLKYVAEGFQLAGE